MLYACVSSFRIRAAQGDFALAVLESLGWIVLDGMVAPSTAMPRYFAYRALGCFQTKRTAQQADGDQTAATSTDAPVASLAPPTRSRRSGAAGLLVSVLVSGTYVTIVYVSALAAWRHLAQASASSSLAAHLGDLARWVQQGDAHQSTVRRLYEQTKANPITRNLMYDNLFSMAATALHVTVCLRQRLGGGLAGSLLLLLTPIVAVANFFTAGAAWAAFLIATELGLLGSSSRQSHASRSAKKKQ